MISVSKPRKIKVCIVCTNTVSTDRRTLTEAEILAKAGLEVIVIGLLGKGHLRYEAREGFVIRRLSTTPSLAIAFRNHLYFPIYRRLPVPSRRLAKRVYKWIVPGLRAIDWRLKKLTIYLRLTRAMLSEQAHYYHAHFPAPLIVVTAVAATLLGRHFIWDYNDILVLECPREVMDMYYEQTALWNRPLDEVERNRLEATILSVPSDVKSILDVGCGNGRVTNRLLLLCPYIVGLDISRRALQFVQTKTYIGSADDLPFEDKSFDLVLATELLEHLSTDRYQKALGEIRRVARRWILVGVPWKEQLSLGYAWCARCGKIFHVNHHCRKFDERMLRSLFKPDFRLTALKTIGGERRCYMPALLWIKRRIGHIWTRTSATICPICRTHLYPGGFPERNAISRFCDKLNERVRCRQTPEKRHVIALYERVGVQ